MPASGWSALGVLLELVYSLFLNYFDKCPHFWMSKHYPFNIWQTDLKEPYKSSQFQRGWNNCCSRCFTLGESNTLKYCVTGQQRESLSESGIYATSIDLQLIFKLLFGSLNTIFSRTTDGYRFVPQPAQNSIAYHLINKRGEKRCSEGVVEGCDHSGAEANGKGSPNRLVLRSHHTHMVAL